MASKLPKASRREGAEIVHGPEECYRQAVNLLSMFGIPEGVIPLHDLQECGIVTETGFVWMKREAPSEHFFTSTNTLTTYDAEVTGYIEKYKFRKVTGVRSKHMMLWFPIHEIRVEPRSKIHFKSTLGLGKSFPITDYMTEDEKRRYLAES